MCLGFQASCFKSNKITLLQYIYIYGDRGAAKVTGETYSRVTKILVRGVECERCWKVAHSVQQELRAALFGTNLCRRSVICTNYTLFF